MKNPRIVVLGSSNTDMIIRLERIPAPGETILGGEFSTAAGGKGANQAVAAARAGGKVSFVARLGRDMFGEKALEGFRKDKLDVTHVSVDAKAPSGVALIFVSHAGENSIAVASSANGTLSPTLARKAAKTIAAAQCLILQLETPLNTVEEAARIARKAKVPVILNPAPAQKLPASLLANVDILTPNEHEACLLTGVKVTNEASARKAADALMKKGIGTVIITMGACGAYIADKATKLYAMVPTFDVKRVDSTAAGDVFNGSFAVAMAEGRPLLEAVRFANAAASLSVMKLGAQPSVPQRAAIDAFLKKQK